MKKLQLSAIKRQVVACLQANIVEALLGLCFFILFIIEDLSLQSEWESFRYVPFLFPTLFVWTYSCHALFTGKRLWGYYLSLLSLVPLVLLSDRINNLLDSPAYGFTIMLTLFLLLGHRKTEDNASFARHCIKLLVNAAFASIIGLLLVGMVVAIYYSVTYIFELHATEKFIEYVAHFTFYLFAPLLFCQLQQDDETDWQTLPKFIQFILNFILTPGIIIYTFILYLYFLTIAIHWELPKGGVAYMVMAFIIVSLAGRMAQLIVSQRICEWFFRPFGFIAIPPLVLFWIGTIHRISAYGLTESRVYLLAAGVLMTLYVFFLYIKRLESYRLMLLVSSMAIILLTYIPSISARSIGIRSQMHRLEHLARELSLWSDPTSKLTGTADFQTEDSVQMAIAHELDACYSYLEREEGAQMIAARFGSNELKLSKAHSAWGYFYRPADDLPIDGYTRYLLTCKIVLSGNGKAEVRQGEHLLLEVDLKEHFALYKEEMDAWKGREATNMAPFRFQNDSCRVFLDTIYKAEDGTYQIQSYADLIVFCK